MASILTSTFRINGVISTDKTVVQNINDLCTACGCWATYDIAEGKWSVIINKPGQPVADFNDSNIIGSINISGTGVTELYNGVSIEFPHKDLQDQTDFVEFEIPAEDRFPNEMENILNIRSDLINDPVQAQYVSVIELKQSRVDKVIQFSTDYAIIGLKAGDLISVTSDMYGYNKKVFRITKIEENDGDDGTLAFSITALEYDSNIYNSNGLTRKIREKKTGIVPKSQNQALSAADINGDTKRGFTPVVFSFNVGPVNISSIDPTATDQVFMEPFIAQYDRYNLNQTKTLPYTGNYRIDYYVNFAAPLLYDPTTGAAKLPPTCRKRARITVLEASGTPLNLGFNATSSNPKGTDPLDDLSLSGYFYGYQSTVLNFYIDARSDLGSTSPGVDGADVYSQLFITATLTYLGQ